MIIWRGFGILVVVIGFGSLILTELIAENIAGDDRFYQEHKWLALFGSLVAAALTYGLYRLTLLRRVRVLVDQATGEEVVLTSKDSLFFIPVQLWPIVFVFFGLIATVADGTQARVHANATTTETQSLAELSDFVYQRLERAGECGLSGDYPKAIQLATEVIEHQPSCAIAYVTRGTAHRRSGERVCPGDRRPQPGDRTRFTDF